MTARSTTFRLPLPSWLHTRFGPSITIHPFLGYRVGADHETRAALFVCGGNPMKTVRSLTVGWLCSDRDPVRPWPRIERPAFETAPHVRARLWSFFGFFTLWLVHLPPTPDPQE
jgi:hypothetical protein